MQYFERLRGEEGFHPENQTHPIRGRRFMWKPLLTALGLYFSCQVAQAQAWDGATTGKIIGLDGVADGMNYGFRVYLDSSQMCGAGTPGWAYLNVNSNNYALISSLITTSWANSRTITIYATKDSTGNCLIGYVLFR